MERKQILYLLIGLLFLAGGFYVLFQMPKRAESQLGPQTVLTEDKETMSSSGTETVSSADAEPVLSSEADDTASPAGESGLTRFLNWLHAQGIPLWVYFLVFFLMVFLLRAWDLKRSVRYMQSRKNDNNSETQEDTASFVGSGKALYVNDAVTEQSDIVQNSEQEE